jgi:DMSO/TMAO reductase YedYZ molybdopterin-dependent catalytic subunit
MDEMALPPGQRARDSFPRFGTHLGHPAPAVQADPSIAVSGHVIEPLVLPLTELASLPRREEVADFHCVAGWSATGLRWEGVPFADLYREVIEPAVRPGERITHVVFGGLDGYRSVVTLEDALAGDVLIAERLDGRPLSSDHGAPVRLVSPSQYGFVSTKHLCAIELHDGEPTERYEGTPRLSRTFLRSSFSPHPRARVWEEERHRHLPAWAVRPVYRALIEPIAHLCARGSREEDER